MNSVFQEITTYKGKDYKIELFLTKNIENIKPVKQVQAVCFLEKDNMVFYQHVEGWNGLPGGGLEKGELIKDTLEREIKEEAGCKLLDYKILGYEKIIKLEDKTIMYFVRCLANVELLFDGPRDPDKKAIERVIVPINKARETLGYGKKGEIWLDEAIKNYDTKSKNYFKN